MSKPAGEIILAVEEAPHAAVVAGLNDWHAAGIDRAGVARRIDPCQPLLKFVFKAPEGPVELRQEVPVRLADVRGRRPSASGSAPLMTRIGLDGDPNDHGADAKASQGDPVRIDFEPPSTHVSPGGSPQEQHGRRRPQ